MEHSPSPRLAMVAGEASGDLLAGLLMAGLKQRWPGQQAFGIGGPRMAAQGFDAWWPSSKLAVRGYVEVLRHYREIAGIRKRLRDRLLADAPDVFIGVDAPDFNLDLEGWLKAAGIKTVHFVSPSIWAWRGERIHKIARCVDHMLCLFPFEPEIYTKAGIAASYVGHPLADAIPLQPPRDTARQALDLGARDTVIALLPGSRRSEVKYIGPVFAQAARLIRKRLPGVRLVLPAAPGLAGDLRAVIDQHGPDAGIELVEGRSHEVLAACDVTLIASGTATLEAALFKRPMVIAYVMNLLSWHIMKNKGYLPWVGLPNILCRDFVVPEFLQHAATPAALADATLAWLDQPQRTEQLQRRFDDLHHQLRRDTATQATHAIAHVLES